MAHQRAGVDQVAGEEEVRKPGALNTATVRAEVCEDENGYYVDLNSLGYLNPSSLPKVVDWFTRAQAWIKLQDKK